MGARCQELIIVEQGRGAGCCGDPVRIVTAVYAKDGILLAERDPCAPEYMIRKEGSGFAMKPGLNYLSIPVDTDREMLHKTGAQWAQTQAETLLLRAELSKLQGADEGRKYEKALRDRIEKFVDASPARQRAWLQFSSKHPLEFPSRTAASRDTGGTMWGPIGEIVPGTLRYVPSPARKPRRKKRR